MNAKLLHELRSLLDVKKQRANKIKEKAGQATEKERNFSKEELRLAELVDLLISSHQTIDLHKPTPAANEEEDAVIGMLLLSHGDIHRVPFLEAHHFYQVSHRNIFQAIRQLSVLDSGAIDMVMITTQLRKAGRLQEAGGAYLIAKLQGKVCQTTTLERHAAVVVEYAMRREAIRISSEIIYSCYDDTCDVLELLERSQEEFIKMLPHVAV